MEETPINKTEAFFNGLFSVLQLVALYGVGLAFWALALKKGWYWYLISLFGLTIFFGIFAGYVIAKQPTIERSKQMLYSVGSLWGGPGMLVCVVGLGFWIFKLVF